MSIADAAALRQGVTVTAEILGAPFAFGATQVDRPPSLARDYVLQAGALYLATTLVGLLASLFRPDATLLLAQTVVSGAVLASLLAGNLVALAYLRIEDDGTDTSGLVAAAQYGAGFSLVLLSLFRLLGLVGLAFVPGYNGSIYEALAVLGSMGAVLFSAFLVLEWPRRIVGLDEAPYYTAVALVFLGLGLLLKLTGAA